MTKKEVTFVIAKGRDITPEDREVFDQVEGKKFIVGNLGDICNPNERYTGVTRLINLTGRKDIDEFYKDILVVTKPKEPEVVVEPEVVEAEEEPVVVIKKTARVPKKAQL